MLTVVQADESNSADLKLYSAAAAGTVTSFADYLLSGKEEAGREKKLEKALFYGGTLLYFHVGVAAGYGASLLWGTRSMWLCALPLLGTAALIETSRRVPAAETAAAGAGR